PENLKRIDDKILKDIAEDIGTEKVVVTPTENVEDVEEKTEKPSGADYEGTKPTIVENEASIPAEEIQPTLSPENDYSQNRGGANAGNAEANPVQDNTAGQAAADQNEIPISEAPTSGEALENALGDLGIS
ncbi:MAG: hypothetical protein Q4B87_02635, partial [Candidatus Saccharibacteria bacterium]|nr:hypothetical protein [Candidatus Saccharibacteria bacterium]